MQYSIADVQQAAIANHTTGQVIAAPAAGHRIVVVGFYLSLDADGEFEFETGASTNLTGAIEVLGDTPTGAFSAMGVFHCAPAERLDLEATAAANGWVRYVVQRV